MADKRRSAGNSAREDVRKSRTSQAQRTKARTKTIDEELHGLDLAMLFVAAFAVLFTVIMIVLFIAFRETPDTLITCVFGAIGIECGAGAYIQTRKNKLEDRKWQLEDEKRMKREEAKNGRSNL